MGVDINTVGVIGLGTMGAGIVEVFAKAGMAVIAVDGSEELAQRGAGFVRKSLDKAVTKGKLEPHARDEALAAITFTAQLSDLADADLVVEAVPERLEIKQSIFTALDDIVREDAVLASNTSSLSVTKIASFTRHPGRVIGMHFFNPAPVLALVEVVTTLFTGDELVERVRSLAEGLGKKPVVVRDRAGFVANALLISYLARAIRTYETGHVGREDLDEAGRLGIGLPMGPLTLCDLIGLDVVKEVCDVLYAGTHDPAAAPPPLLEQMVIAGRLGRKTGRGFYSYAKTGSEATEPAQAVARAGSVTVVGSGDLAQALVSRLQDGGVEVAAITGPGEDLTPLADSSMAWLVSSPPEHDDDDDAEQAWFTEIAHAVGHDTVVVPTDDQCGWMIGEYLDEGTPVVPARIHVPTRSGQVAEVACGIDAAAPAVEQVSATLRAAGFYTIVARDRAGLVVDALLYPHLNAACQMLDSGYASATDIDTALTAGCGYPKGPFAMIDEIGADEVAAGLARMHGETGDPALSPSPLLIEHAVTGRPFMA